MYFFYLVFFYLLSVITFAIVLFIAMSHNKRNDYDMENCIRDSEADAYNFNYNKEVNHVDSDYTLLSDSTTI